MENSQATRYNNSEFSIESSSSMRQHDTATKTREWLKTSRAYFARDTTQRWALRWAEAALASMAAYPDGCVREFETKNCERAGKREMCPLFSQISEIARLPTSTTTATIVATRA